MRRQISVSDVTLGMYIHELCGSWMDHPFWKSGFLLDSQEDLQRLKQSSVTQVWIDISKGLNTSQGVSAAEADALAMDVLEQAVEQQPKKTSMADEIRRATRICVRSKQAVMDMFSEARMGNAIDLSSVETALNEITDSVSRHPGALISLARLKQADEYTYMHSVAVAALMTALARQMQM